MQKFLLSLAHDRSKVTYGLEHVNKAIDLGAVDTVLISEQMPDADVEKLEEKAKMFNTKVVIISVDTREGVQLREMGRVAALLRFPIE